MKAPVVQINRGKRHYVNACGSPEDGSLVGFYTYCGLQLTSKRRFEEVDSGVDCAHCQSIIDASKRELPKANK